LTVADPDGKEIRKINGGVTAGLHRVVWNLRGAQVIAPPAAAAPATGGDEEEKPNADRPPAPRRGGGGRGGPDAGQMVKPGKYTVTLNKQNGGVLTPIGEPQTFEVVPLPGPSTQDSTKPNPGP
jgi:hypothetical protein